LLATTNKIRRHCYDSFNQPGAYFRERPLVADHFFTLVLDGRQETARALVESFTADAVAKNPELATLVAAEQLAHGSLERAAAHLAMAERQASVVPNERREQFELALAVARLTLARQRGDFQSLLDQMSILDAPNQPQDVGDLALYADVRALAVMNLGIIEAWSGRHEDGGRHLLQARELARRIGRAYIEVGCLAHLAYTLRWRSFTHTQAACAEAITLAERYGWAEDPVIAPALLTLAVITMQAGRLDEAEQWLERTDRTLRTRVEPAMGFLLHLTRAVTHLVRGRTGAALRSFLDARRMQQLLASSLPQELMLTSLILEARLRLGRSSQVRSELAHMSPAHRDWTEIRIVTASLALADGDPAAAVDALAPMVARSSPAHHVGDLVSGLIVEARAREQLNDHGASENAIEQALELAASELVVVPFLFWPCRELLERHRRRRATHRAFVHDVLGLLSATSPRPVPPETLPGEALSDAELRVLRCLPSGLSAREMARELELSANTIKTHMRHIYAKLRVHERGEAVQRARQIGLVGSYRHS
jgi:LuxR family maltose regulon positive regulatory protein